MSRSSTSNNNVDRRSSSTSKKEADSANKQKEQSRPLALKNQHRRRKGNAAFTKHLQRQFHSRVPNPTSEIAALDRNLVLDPKHGLTAADLGSHQFDLMARRLSKRAGKQAPPTAQSMAEAFGWSHLLGRRRASNWEDMTTRVPPPNASANPDAGDLYVFCHHYELGLSAEDVIPVSPSIALCACVMTCNQSCICECRMPQVMIACYQRKRAGSGLDVDPRPNLYPEPNT